MTDDQPICWLQAPHTYRIDSVAAGFNWYKNRIDNDLMDRHSSRED